MPIWILHIEINNILCFGPSYLSFHYTSCILILIVRAADTSLIVIWLVTFLYIFNYYIIYACMMTSYTQYIHQYVVCYCCS